MFNIFPKSLGQLGSCKKREDLFCRGSWYPSSYGPPARSKQAACAYLFSHLNPRRIEKDPRLRRDCFSGCWRRRCWKLFSWDVAAVKPAGSDTGLPVSSKKHQKMLIWEISAFWAVFLHMSVIAQLLAFLRFVHFEGKIMSVFSREISTNTREKNVNAHASRHKCALSSSSEHKKCYVNIPGIDYRLPSWFLTLIWEKWGERSFSKFPCSSWCYLVLKQSAFQWRGKRWRWPCEK